MHVILFVVCDEGKKKEGEMRIQVFLWAFGKLTGPFKISPVQLKLISETILS